MKKIKMIVFDVDGTLYDLENQEIPSSTIDAISKIKAKGIKFVIASGRAHYGLDKSIYNLNPDYVIACNGGVISDHNLKVIRSIDMSKHDTECLVEFADKYDAGLLFKFDDHMYIYNHPEKINWLKEHMEGEVGSEPFIFHPEHTRHLQNLPQSCSLHADEKLINKLLVPNTNLDFLKYIDDGFDVINKGINKAVGLKMLLEYLNVDEDEVMCFGDNYNDIEMMKMIKNSVAMGNAIDELKEIASYTTTKSSEDGIYNALVKLGIIE